MNRVTRRRVDRRGAALDRLQSITTGAAIAGVAATAAFGALAAFTFSGTATAADAPARQNLTDGVVGSDDAVRTEPEAQDVAPFLLAPEPRSATGRGDTPPPAAQASVVISRRARAVRRRTALRTACTK